MSLAVLIFGTIGARIVPAPHRPLSTLSSPDVSVTVGKCVPVEALEESVLLDVVHTVVQVSDAFALISVEQLSYQVLKTPVVDVCPCL